MTKTILYECLNCTIGYMSYTNKVCIHCCKIMSKYK